VKAKIYAALAAGFHSTYITFAAVTAGLLTAAVASGNAGNPETLWTYVKANAFGYVVANVVAPTIRAAAAAKGT
jgi:hypothetical protein